MTKPSLIEALNVAIKSQKFFDKLFVVKQQDVLEINSHDFILLNTCLSEKHILNFINQKNIIANNPVGFGISAETIP